MLHARIVVALVGLAAISSASTARAVELQKSGPEEWPSKHELSAHMGYQAGFGAQYAAASPSGIKLNVEYAYRFHEIAWFDLQLSNMFGIGDQSCAPPTLSAYCYRGGWNLEVAGGVKLKFRTRIPLVFELPILIGLDGLYNRSCGDNGVAAPLLRTGGGVKYFLTRKIGVGLQTNLTFGPAFHSATNFVQRSCIMTTSYTDFYGAWDVLIGGEFLL